MDPTAKSAAKRKRQENGDKSKKRRKSGGAEENEQQSQIKRLEAEILESRKHYNNIATLLKLANGRTGADSLAATEALCRVFISLLALGNLVKKEDASEKDATVTAWLRDRLSEYHQYLCAMLNEETAAVKIMVLAMALLKAEALHTSDGDTAVFPQARFGDLVTAILQSPIDQLRNEFYDNFLNEYEDIRFYTLQTIP